MLTNHLLTRRQVAAQFAVFSAAATLNPFPKVIQPTRAAQGTPAPIPAPPEQQVLRWGGIAPVPRLGVHHYAAFLQTFSPNLWMPPFHSNDAGDVLPGVCLDYAVSSDGLEYILSLDPEARWSDGSMVTAGDVKFTWEFMANPDSRNGLQYYQTQAVIGHREVFEGRATEMAGLEVVDDAILRVRLAAPFTPFVPYLTQIFNGVMQRAAIEADGPDWDLLPTPTNGPYMVESFDAELGELACVPNPFWWRETPRIQRIEYRVVPDPNTLSILWDNDEIDIQNWTPETALQYQGSTEETLVKRSAMHIAWCLFLNMAIPPFDDQQFRRAVLLASDVGTIIPAIFRQDIQPAYGAIHPSTPGGAVRPSLFDPEAARTALAQSAYASGEVPSIVFATGPDDPFRPVFEALQQGWQEVLDLRPAILPVDPGADPEEIGANLRFGGPAPLFQDAGGQMTWAFRADNTYFREWIGTRDGELEALLDEADAIPLAGIEERVALYRRAEDLVLERAYVIPVAFGDFSFLVKPWIANAEFRPDASPVIADMYVTER